ncbi:hypothetical protein [[Eubacterium] cellulosolvens]
MNTKYSLIIILLTTAFLGTNFIPRSNMETIGQPVQLNFVEGSWEGNMIGEGTVMAEYDVTINATITGTLEGSPQFGTWNGKYQATYKWNSHMENDIGFLKGNYSWNMDDSGKVTGTVVSKVSGLLVGDWELQLNGSLRETGIIEGTWTGKFIPTYFSYGRVTPVPTTLRLQGSGEFEAKLQEKIVTTSESTSQTTPTAPSPITTIETPPLDEIITNESQMLLTILRIVFIIGIILIIILIAAKVLKSDH